MSYEAWRITFQDSEKAARAELRGKNLACWCPLGPENDPHHDPYEDCCHAAVLLEIAND